MSQARMDPVKTERNGTIVLPDGISFILHNPFCASRSSRMYLVPLYVPVLFFGRPSLSNALQF
jgi:hypothetical protein